MSSDYLKTPNYKPINADSSKIVQIADKAIHYAKETLVANSWGPLVVLGGSLSFSVPFYTPLICTIANSLRADL